MTITLKDYAPIISDDETAIKILELIKKELQHDNVQIDMSDVKLMVTKCAKSIFGSLYLDMGSKCFFEKIQILNASDNVKAVINLGIIDAIHHSIDTTKI